MKNSCSAPRFSLPHHPPKGGQCSAFRVLLKKRRKIAQSFFLASFGSLLIAAVSPAFAALNDIYPGDYLPAPAGQTAMVSYLYDRALRGPNEAGVSGPNGRTTQTLIVLGAQYFDLVGWRANVAVSGGKSWQSTTDSISAARVDGFTDPKLSMTVWPYRDEQRGRFVAVNAAYVFGKGSYDRSASQNIGQNRDRSILSLSWGERTTEATMLEVTAELARFGTNPELAPSLSRLEQRDAYAVTGFWRYRINEQFSPYVGAQLNWGGETIVDGTPKSDSVRGTRAYLGLRYQSDPSHIFHLRAAADRDVQWGYALKREWVFRWTWLPK